LALKLEELKEIEAKATPGPWSYNGQGGYVCFMSIEDGRPINYVSAPQSPGMHLSHLDASFIAAARTMLPRLIKVAEACKTYIGEGHDLPALIEDALAALEAP
jgi:hypothetical protein